MVGKKELIEKFGMTSEELTELERDAIQYESGNWPEGKTTIIGRPPLYDGDELGNVTFRIRKSRLKALERASKQVGKSRSEFLRDAVEEALSKVSVL